MARKVKPGTPHPTRKGLVMGKNGSYVAKTTYAKQVRAAQAAEAASKKGGAIVKADSSAITKPNNKGGGLAKTGGSQKALPGSNSKALPPGKPGGALKIAKGASGASRVLGALGIVGGMAGEVQEMSDRAKRDAERNQRLNRRPFEELRADSRSGNPKRTGQGSRRPAAPKPTDKQIAALTQKGGIFYQGPGKPKPDNKKPAASGGGGSSPTASKPKPKPQTVNGKTVKRVGPVNTPADKPNIKSTRAQLAIDKAMAPARQAYLKSLQADAKKKSLEQAKKNRERNRRRKGPRD